MTSVTAVSVTSSASSGSVVLSAAAAAASADELDSLVVASEEIALRLTATSSLAETAKVTVLAAPSVRVCVIELAPLS